MQRYIPPELGKLSGLVQLHLGFNEISALG
ncbi:Hypothetical leucine rich repeat protein [Ectocarpus siliculosus]|uniref:Hypothetical leucine rich repeat protein n=1 Tax=Ectocarpus siliculosus TaxID=2880 RepID=D8LKS6_ECTSI|nr:Hypothetical leucine rich repeat protein [Ectocarpus siliculosus]|eukprot:CBN80059.1 Hypothetical leucine rich repeat protein [Ectocarpus siliculosus]